MPTYQLAQVNIARLKAPLDSPELIDYVATIDSLNTLADQSPGFVWRLKTDQGDATAIRAFDDALIIVNLSVWESAEALKNYTYLSEHAAIMKRRREWFTKFESAYLVLWWIESGQFPTPAQARQRLELLDREGPTPQAFTFWKIFPQPEEAIIL
jgi:heme-degrading monooxygenase HmoA